MRNNLGIGVARRLGQAADLGAGFRRLDSPHPAVEDRLRLGAKYTPSTTKQALVDAVVSGRVQAQTGI